MRHSYTRRIQKERANERHDICDYDEPRARPVCWPGLLATRLLTAPQDNFEKEPRRKQQARKQARHGHA